MSPESSKFELPDEKPKKIESDDRQNSDDVLLELEKDAAEERKSGRRHLPPRIILGDT